MRFYILFVLIVATSVFAQKDPESRKWNQPVEPFRIIDNIYYVGALEVTSFLITTPGGHILLDGGFEETAPMIRANIERLGFHVQDVRILLSSHAHYDHAGGLPELKRISGAKFLSSAGDAPQHARGGLDDPQFGDRFPYPRLYADKLVADGERVRIGTTTMMAHITAGHTKGCSTWTTTARDAGKNYDVIFVCSPTVPSDYKLVGNLKCPEIIEDYRKQFAELQRLKPDVFLAAHGSFFDFFEKAEEARRGNRLAFVDPKGYRRFVNQMQTAFEERVRKQTP